MSESQPTHEFNVHYESIGLDFLNQYDRGNREYKNSLEYEVINDNVGVYEVERAIDYLKNNKSPGIDGIPAEFLKCCKSTLSPDITIVLNHIIYLKDFPDMWTEGLKSAVFKSGSKLSTDNYRGITVLPIFEKIFEIIVYHRLSFANEAFAKEDKYNGGFLPGHRTSDNLFILQGLIQRQLCIGSHFISQNYERRLAWPSNWYTSKFIFRVKSKGRVSSIILSKLGVNKGGVASGSLFRIYTLGKKGCYTPGWCVFLWLFLFHQSVRSKDRLLFGVI